MFLFHAFPRREWSGHLNVGVAIFFALSGFLLYRPFASARAHGTPAPSVRAYLVRRALRILPGYWVALTVTLALGLLPVDALLATYTLTQLYVPGHAFDGLVVTWSLSAEASFYLVLPLWALLAAAAFGGRLRARGELTAMALVAVTSVCFRALMLDDAGYGPAVWGWLPSVAIYFLVGMALAVVSVAAQVPGRGSAGVLGRAPLWWALAVVALAVLTVAFPPTGASARPSILTDIAEYLLAAALAAFVLLGAAFAATEDPVTRLLRWAPLAWLGLISYGLFLWQIVALHVILDEVGLSGRGGVLAAALLTVACAAASY